MSHPESWTTDEEIETKIRAFRETGHAATLGAAGGLGRGTIGEKTAEVMDHLREHTAAGETRHFTAREIGWELDRPAVSVGVSLVHVREQASEFEAVVDSSEQPHLWAITRAEDAAEDGEGDHR